MPQLYLSLGSNEGDREALLHQAIDAIDRLIGPVGGIATFIETEPWGFESPPPPSSILHSYSPRRSPHWRYSTAPKRSSGSSVVSARVWHGHYHDRPIDIDLLFYDDLVLESKRLTLPHPLNPLTERLFVLEPFVRSLQSLFIPS